MRILAKNKKQCEREAIKPTKAGPKTHMKKEKRKRSNQSNRIGQQKTNKSKTLASVQTLGLSSDEAPRLSTPWARLRHRSSTNDSSGLTECGRFAYIEFASKDAVENALLLNESEFHGRALKVEQAPLTTALHV